MTASAALIEARQQTYLKQLLEHQLALKHLLDQQPEAAGVLADLLDAKIQRSFLDHPPPVTLEAVSYEEHIKLTLQSGSETVVHSGTAQRPLSALFNDKPWGGENFDAPNRFYRYYAKATYQVNDPSAPHKLRTINSTIGSTPAFETFIEELIRRPDRHYQQQLDRFWRGAYTPGNPMTRRQWLADQLAKALLAEAALRVEDGTLDESCKTLVGQIVSHPSSQSRAHLPQTHRPAAFSLSLKGRNDEPDIPLAGVFVLSSKTPVADIDANTDIGAVALFTQDVGIDSFVSLQALDQFLRTRFTNAGTGDSLMTHITWQDQARANGYQASPLFSYIQVHENLFENRVHALLALQKQDIEYGWRQLPRHEVNGKQVHELFNRLATIGSFLDTRDLLIERSRRFIEASLPSWYREAGPADQQALKRLAESELAANKILATKIREAAIPLLRDFSRKELVRQLAIDYPDKEIDPDKVPVTMTTSINPASTGGGVGADQVPYSSDPTIRPEYTITLSLTEFALKNSNPWDFSFYKLFTGEKTSMSASGKTTSGAPIQFDASYLTSLVQTLDVSKGYDQLLQTRLMEKGSSLRKTWIDAHRASLATHALAARLDPNCFLEDRENRGYQWVKALIDGDTPASRKTVGKHRIVASSLLIANSPDARNGYNLNDVLMISVDNRRALPNVILYTPWAPTGHAIKEFADSATMQQFLKDQWNTSPEWRHYFMQRLSTPGQAALTESKVARTLLLSELVLNARSRIGNPFDTLHTFAINTSLHDALYEQQVVTLRRNADHQSTSNAEVERQSLWNKISFGLDLSLNLISFLPITSAFKAVRSVTRTFLLLNQMAASKSAARALWSITAAKGRPLRLPAFGAVPAFRPAPDLSGIEVAVNPLDLDLIKGNLFQSKTSPQQYVLIARKHYLCDIAQGQRFLYPQGTGYKTLRYPLVLDETLENWQAEPMLRLSGGMGPIEKGPLQTTYLDYELPPADLAALPALNLSLAGSMSLGMLHPTFAMNAQTAGVLHIFAIQSRLRRHARSYFRTFQAPARQFVLPGRNLSPDQLFQYLFGQRNGLVFGETHHYSLTRQFLINNMAELKRQGVRGFYLEVLNTDLHQALLDQFNASPTAHLPQVLRDRLQLVDDLSTVPDAYSYTRLVEEAHAQAIPVMALDTTASSLITAQTLIPSHILPTLSDQLDRVTMFNFFAWKKISFDQLAHGPHRWVALVGQGHSNTLQSIPGLVELTNASSVRVDSRIATQPSMRVKSDPGIVIHSPSGTHQVTHGCDLLACLPCPTNEHEIAFRVHSPNQFTTTRTPSGQIAVHYVNAQGERIDVPVFADGSQAYVNHAAFGAVSNRRFSDLDALTDALMDELAMIEV